MYLLLATTICAAALYSIILHKIELRQPRKTFLFNLMTSLVWCVLLFFAGKNQLNFNGQVLFWGILYGMVQASFIFFKAAVMNAGSVSISTLIGSSSIIFSVFVSLVVWKERVSVIQLFGMLLFVIALTLCTYTRSSASMKGRQIIYNLCFFFFSAGVGLVFKAFSKSNITEQTDTMMLISAIVMTLCYTIMYLFTKRTDNVDALFKSDDSKKKFLIYAIISGFLSCLYNRLNIHISGNMDAIIFFPGFNGGVLILSTILSHFVFREVLAKRQIFGLAMGIFAILVLGIF